MIDLRDNIYRISDVDDWAQGYMDAPDKPAFMKKQYGLMYDRREVRIPTIYRMT